MKKKFLLSLTLVALTFYVSAQITIIPKVGVTVSKVAFKENEEIKYKPGFMGGVAFNFPIWNVFSVQPEFHYIQKGFIYSTSETTFGRTIKDHRKTQINYVEIPILAKASFGNFFINAGPSVGFGLNGKTKSYLTHC
jgi:hypothetical protein